MKLKYLDNDTSRGLVYDWPAIRAEYNKLGCPSAFYNPTKVPIEKASWIVNISERVSGKTTNWLLFGMCMFKLYGTVTIYARPDRDDVAPKNAGTIFRVILENNYIETLTEGKYNNIHYKSKRWYFCRTDEVGNIEEICPDHFCRMISLDESGKIKSGCNEPKGDLFLLDEFIPIEKWKQRPNEFVSLFDCISTIFRLRETGKIVLLANTLDKYNQYFHDLEVFERLMPMEPGDSCIHTTDDNTHIYIELIGPPKEFREKKKRWNDIFAGFKKPELSAITGKSTWVVKNYPHIPYKNEQYYVDRHENTNRTLFNKFYIEHLNKCVNIEFVDNADIGLCAYVHWAEQPHKDSIIFSNTPVYDPRYHYGSGLDTRAGQILKRLFQLRRVFFASNDVGSFVEGYFATVDSSYKSVLL